MYGVSIQSAPSSPIAQTCTVSNGGGTMGGAAVTNVAVDCDMLAYFPFTGNANDASGYGNNGVVTNATLTADRNGVANSAYSFNGVGYIDAAMPTGFLPYGDASRTLSAWLQPTQGTNEWGVVYWGTGNCNALQFGIGDQSGDQATFWGGCNDFESSLLIPVSTVSTPAWTFVSVVYSQAATTTITVYVNGTSTQGTIADLVTPMASDFIMGADLINTAYFVGNLDSIRVYGHALSAAEVQSIYTSSAP
jgi:Concanavalin A-like lectin/glucanases superfamily